MRERPVSIAILAVPEATASVTYGMFDFFMSAGRDWGLVVNGSPGPAVMAPQVVASRTGPFVAGNGISLAAHATLDATPSPDIVCIPELLVAPAETIDGRFVPEVRWVRSCYERGSLIATACSGALLLAEAGLLDGREATTHWAYTSVFARRYPKVSVRTKQAMVVTGEGQRIVMAGGGSSWLDLALYLIARTVSVEAAMQVAKLNLVNWHNVGQQPFARLACAAQADDALIGRCQAWIGEHYDEPSPVAGMLRMSGLAERSFKRRFKEATGMAPLDYVHTLRLEEAKHMLEASDETVESIANAVGYEDAGFFGRLFRRHVQLTPAQYRKRFGSMRRALAE